MGGLEQMPPAAKLKELEGRIAGLGESAETLAAIRGRIGDLVVAVTEARAALLSDAADKLDRAARGLVNCYWMTGHGWRRYLAGPGGAAGLGRQIGEALAADLRPIVDEVRRRLEGMAAGRVSRNEDGYEVGCSICGEGVLRFSSGDGSMQAISLSPVNTTMRREAVGSERLRELAEGDVAAVFEHLAAEGGCAVYCNACGRVYCRAHYAVEAVWSGSWHEASYATCPLGHEREFE
ncbi:MAG: hypothetical protein ABSG84_13690 [Acidobacteriaceae bacterium]|jgi:hypothetical protein